MTFVFATFFHPSHCPVATLPRIRAATRSSALRTAESRSGPASLRRSGMFALGRYLPKNWRNDGLFAQCQGNPHATISKHKSSANSFCSAAAQGWWSKFEPPVLVSAPDTTLFPLRIRFKGRDDEGVDNVVEMGGIFSLSHPLCRSASFASILLISSTGICGHCFACLDMRSTFPTIGMTPNSVTFWTPCQCATARAGFMAPI